MTGLKTLWKERLTQLLNQALECSLGLSGSLWLPDCKRLKAQELTSKLPKVKPKSDLINDRKYTKKSWRRTNEYYNNWLSRDHSYPQSKMISKNGKSRFKRFSNLGVLIMPASNALIEQMMTFFLKLVELRLSTKYPPQRENASTTQSLINSDLHLADIVQT